MACVNVVAADTDSAAATLATSVQQLFLGIITGKRKRLQPPNDALLETITAEQQAAMQQMLQYSFVGSKTTIEKKLKRFIADTGIDEIMATSHIFDHEARLHSYTLFAEAMKA